MKTIIVAIFAFACFCMPAMADPLIMMTPVVVPKSGAPAAGNSAGIGADKPNVVSVNGAPIPYEVPSITIPLPKKESSATITMTKEEFDKKVLEEAAKISMQQEMIRPDVKLKDPSNPFDPTVTSSRPRFDQIEDLKKMAGGDGRTLASTPNSVISNKSGSTSQGTSLVYGPDNSDDDDGPVYFPSRRKSSR